MPDVDGRKSAVKFVQSDIRVTKFAGAGSSILTPGFSVSSVGRVWTTAQPAHKHARSLNRTSLRSAPQGV